jgi:hypothetical protein
MLALTFANACNAMLIYFQFITFSLEVRKTRYSVFANYSVMLTPSDFARFATKNWKKASAHFITKHPHFATEGLLVC